MGTYTSPATVKTGAPTLPHPAVLKWLCPILLQGQKHGAQATAVQRLQCCAFAAFEENLSDARQQRAEDFWCSLRVSRYAFASAY